MKREDEKEVLSCIRELAKSDVVVSTFLKHAEVEARLTMMGERVSREYLDDTIISNSLASMIKTILILQTKRIEDLIVDLAEANAQKTIVLSMD